MVAEGCAGSLTVWTVPLSVLTVSRGQLMQVRDGVMADWF